MDDFALIAATPGLRRLFDLAWRTFGVNPALVSPDAGTIVIFDKEARAQPFCRALRGHKEGLELCEICDRSKFLTARRESHSVRYRCHAGLTEFIIPVIRRGETIALIQCGQLHDRVPTPAEWKEAQRALVQAGIPTKALGSLFRKNRVLGEEGQNDLLELMELIAARLSNADERDLRITPGRAQVALGRTITFIEAHLREPLSADSIAQASGLSERSLMRLFRQEMATTITEFVQKRRVAAARRLLRQTDRTCAEIAFEVGFGSVQHFNRTFRRLQNLSPTEWREGSD